MMNSKITSLASDDVVFLKIETFKVSRLKNLILEKIQEKWNKGTYDKDNQKNDGYVYSLLTSIYLNSEYINFDKIAFSSVQACEVLSSEVKGWQKGKIKISISIFNHGRSTKFEVNLEFYPDEFIEGESPLDDIRKRIQAPAT